MKLIFKIFFGIVIISNNLINCKLFYSRVNRTYLKYSTIITIIPQGCPLHLNICDSSTLSLDDDHFCSKLSDKGYKVHVVISNIRLQQWESNDNSYVKEDNTNSFNNEYYDKVFNEFFEWRHSSSTNKLKYAIMANELSIPKLLAFISKILLNSNKFSYKINSDQNYLTSSMNLLNAIILLDSPPLRSLQDKSIRNVILNRYKESLQSMSTFEDYLQLPYDQNTGFEKHRLYIESISKSSLLYDLLYDNLDTNTDNNQDDDLTPDELKYLDNIFIQSDQYDNDIILTNYRKSKKYLRYKSWLKNSRISDMNSKTEVIDKDNRIDEQELIGPPVYKPYELGMILKNRILVLTSYNETNDDNDDDDNDDDYENNDNFNDGIFVDLLTSPTDIPLVIDKADTWSYESACDTSDLYSAGNVISVHPSSHIDNEYEDDTDFNDLIWSKYDIIRHDRIANVVNDWLTMLTICGYLQS